MKAVFYPLFFTFVLISNFSFAQTNARADQKSESVKRSAKTGTYQIIFKSKDATPVSITEELLQKIESSRDEKKITYLYYENYSIKILSLALINDPKFKPIEEYIVIESK